MKGVVYLTDEDVARMAAYLGISNADFESRYVYRTRKTARLRIPRKERCHFLQDGGCRVHAVKPLQCRTFPFWPELIQGAPRPGEAWREAAKYCPGIGKGELVNIQSAREQAAEMSRAFPQRF